MASPTPHPYKLFLPLWKRVVFIDWFGVLSTDLFWHTIVSNQKHPYHKSVMTASEHLFRVEVSRVRSWMRGHLSASEIVGGLNVTLDRRSKEDFLLRRLLRDCSRTALRVDFLHAVRSVAQSSYLVIATDNMDCFVDQVLKISYVEESVDDILASSKLGVLKTDSIQEFFGPWLKDHKLSYHQAILIDDNEKTCKEFQSYGGHAISFKSVDTTLRELSRWADEHES
jgi:FMN phosphatase YigB (HAD superfamily)